MLGDVTCANCPSAVHEYVVAPVGGDVQPSDGFEFAVTWAQRSPRASKA